MVPKLVCCDPPAWKALANALFRVVLLPGMGKFVYLLAASMTIRGGGAGSPLQGFLCLVKFAGNDSLE